MNSTKKTVVYVIIAIIVAGGLGFLFGNMHGAAASTTARTTAYSGAAGRGSFAGRTGAAGATGGGLISGQILSNDGSTITIALTGNGITATSSGTNAGSRIVVVSDTTQILKTTSGSSSDLTVGTPVSVSGTTNSDGSITATMIQVRSGSAATRGGTGAGAAAPAQQ
jgi:hypothetical protein